MPYYCFEMELRQAPDLDFESVADALYGSGCDDALYGVYESIPQIDFDREAETLAEAIGSAVRHVTSVPGVEVVKIEIETTEPA